MRRRWRRANFFRAGLLAFVLASVVVAVLGAAATVSGAGASAHASARPIVVTDYRGVWTMRGVGAPLQRLADCDYGDEGDLSSDGQRLLMDYEKDVLMLPLSADLVRLGDCADGPGAAIRNRYRLRIGGAPRRIEEWLSLALSPDGRRIAALEMHPAPVGTRNPVRLAVFAADGSGYRVVKPKGLDKSIDPWVFRDLAWSPSGDELLVIHRSELIVMAADGSNARVIYTGQHPNSDAYMDLSYADWSRAGIVFTEADSEKGVSRVAFVAADGSGYRALTRWGADVKHPSWSPDGTTIAYLRSGLYLTTADGSRIRKLPLRPADVTLRHNPVFPSTIEW